jgi:hypothetical protein
MLLIKIVKFLMMFLAGFIAIILLFYFLFLSESIIVLDNEPQIKPWIGKKFETTKGIFICRPVNEKRNLYYLKLPKNDTPFPLNTAEYLGDPENWGHFKNDWYRPLQPGAKLKICAYLSSFKASCR